MALWYQIHLAVLSKGLKCKVCDPCLMVKPCHHPRGPSLDPRRSSSGIGGGNRLLQDCVAEVGKNTGPKGLDFF